MYKRQGICECTRTHMHVRAHTHAQTHTDTHTDTQSHKRVCGHTCARMHARTHARALFPTVRGTCRAHGCLHVYAHVKTYFGRVLGPEWQRRDMVQLSLIVVTWQNTDQSLVLAYETQVSRTAMYI